MFWLSISIRDRPYWKCRSPVDKKYFTKAIRDCLSQSRILFQKCHSQALFGVCTKPAVTYCVKHLLVQCDVTNLRYQIQTKFTPEIYPKFNILFEVGTMNQLSLPNSRLACFCTVGISIMCILHTEIIPFFNWLRENNLDRRTVILGRLGHMTLFHWGGGGRGGISSTKFSGRHNFCS